MSVPLNAFKGAKLFSSSKLQEMNPDIETVEQSLSSIPFITVSDILALKDEYPQYVAASKDVSIHYDPLQFWKNHSSTLQQKSCYCFQQREFSPFLRILLEIDN